MDDQDRAGARLLISKIAIYFDTIKLIDWALSFFNIVWIVIKRSRKVFNIMNFRWIVERAFDWINYQRRLSKDYEFYPKNSEAFVKFATIGMMVRRISSE